MTDLPEGFQFSQGSLQDFVDCPRRFYLRHIRQLAWPAVLAEPADEYEADAADGEAFHLMAQQDQIGVEPSLPTPPAPLPTREGGDISPPLAGEGSGERLAAWWRNYREAGPEGLPAVRHAEASLSAPLGAYRLLAQYDLIAVEPGARAVIVDWKTSQRRPEARWLAARMQTRVYRYLLVRAGAALNEGRPFAPAQVEMVYWFANFPDQPERLRYDAARYQADEVYFNTLIAQIERAEGEDAFPLTGDERRCRFCSYRSLCNRGVEAGEMDEAVDVEALGLTAEVSAAFDYEQAAEIAF